MKKLVLVVMLLSLVGCASTGSVENLQSQIDVIKVDVDATAKVAQEAKVVASQAAVSAAFAAKRSLDAVQSQEEISAKLDRLFKKRMEK